MDTTTAKTPVHPYTDEDGQHGTILNMVLGFMLGIATFFVKMATHTTALNGIVPIGGLIAVGVHMMAYAVSENHSNRSTYNLLGTAAIVAFCNLSYLGLSVI
jgi:hypothetical protein